MRVRHQWAVLVAGRFVAMVVAGMSQDGKEEEGVEAQSEDIPEHWQLTPEQCRFIDELLKMDEPPLQLQ